MFDIKQQKMTKFSQKMSKLYTFFESTYPEMQRKHIPGLNELKMAIANKKCIVICCSTDCLITIPIPIH